MYVIQVLFITSFYKLEITFWKFSTDTQGYSIITFALRAKEREGLGKGKQGELSDQNVCSLNLTGWDF